jgi:hypothetical protein
LEEKINQRLQWKEKQTNKQTTITKKQIHRRVIILHPQKKMTQLQIKTSRNKKTQCSVFFYSSFSLDAAAAVPFVSLTSFVCRDFRSRGLFLGERF